VAVGEIRRILAAKADAVVRRATDDLAALLDPDFIYVNASGKTFDKAGYLDTYSASGKVIFTEQRFSRLEVEEFVGFAVATLVVHDEFTTGGRDTSATYRSLCVFGNDKGRWLWAAGQTMATR
jgi:ketosteroid isomerase-like protein